VTTITPEQGESVDAINRATLLRKAGFSCKFSHNLVQMSKLNKGIRMVPMYNRQGIAQIQFLVGHIRMNTKTGKYIVNIIEKYQIYIRIKMSILQSEAMFVRLKYPEWIDAIIDFCQKYKIFSWASYWRPEVYHPEKDTIADTFYNYT